VFDPKVGSWKSLAPRPHKTHGFQMAAFGKYLYAFGGFAYEEKNKPKWKSIDVIDRYDTESNTWETIGQMPRARSSNQAVTVGTKVYLIGGWDATPKSPGDLEGTFHSAVDIFDLETEMITSARWEIPLPLRRAFTALENEGNIIMVGGLGVGASHFELLNNVTLIEPSSGFHKELPVLPYSTFAPAAGILGDELLVFGGMFKTGTMNYEYVSHIFAMNLSKQKWRHTGRYLSETKGFSQVTDFEEGLAIIGGHRSYAERDEPVTTFEFISR
jgi:N-acetylneuraminic acid mutarotase